VACLHGDCTQDQRDTAVRDFKAGKSQVLVATDVAARGLHVKNLPYIVNYDFPSNLETYKHRAGRTGVIITQLTRADSCVD
jgi:ATP-dependent RNA helicase DDX5/DBP2